MARIISKRHIRKKTSRPPGRNTIVRFRGASSYKSGIFNMLDFINIFKYFFFLILAVGLIYGGSFIYDITLKYLRSSDYFEIKEIEVLPGKNVTVSEIRELIPFQAGDNLFRVNLKTAETKIKKHKPELKNISMSRHWQKIVISYAERVPVAVIKTDDIFIGVDYDNEPFGLRGYMVYEEYPVIDSKDKTKIGQILNFIKIFKPEAGDFFKEIKSFKPYTLNDILIETNSGLKIYWGEMESSAIDNKIKKLKTVLIDSKQRFKDGIESINLSYADNGRVIVLPKQPV